MTVLRKSKNGFWYITLNSGVVHPQLIHIRFPMDGAMDDDGSYGSTPSERLPLIIPSHTWEGKCKLHSFYYDFQLIGYHHVEDFYLFIYLFWWNSHERKDGIFGIFQKILCTSKKTFWENFFSNFKK